MTLERGWEMQFTKQDGRCIDNSQKLKSIRHNISPIDWPLIPMIVQYCLEIDNVCTEMLDYSFVK